MLGVGWAAPAAPAARAADATPAPTISRLAGADRYATSAAISAATFSPGVPVVYLANGANFPDALSGGPVAAAAGGPILLVTATSVPAVIQAEIKRLQPATIVALGGTSVVSDAVLASLASIAPVSRLAGADRYATSAAISAATFSPGVPVVYLANGANFPDALSGGPVAAAAGGPILLVTATSVPAVIQAEIKRLQPATIVALGGTSVVSDAVLASLASIAPVSRLAGADRYATSAAISAATFSPGVPVVYLANGANFPDALSGGPVAAAAGGPILLVTATSVPAVIQAEIKRLQPATIVALGGTSVVSDAVLYTAAGLTPPAPPIPPLPACLYKDLTTSRAAYSEYATTLLDTIYGLPSGYSPSGLVSTRLSGGGLVRPIVSVDLKAMVAAASAAGARLANVSAYRSYSTQVSTFAHWVRVGGMAAALRTSARAGHSEHQLGTVIDFSTYGGGSPFIGDWATTKAGAWMLRNGWTYGWVMSYPKGKTSVSCYAYEPWHYRWVGRTEAKAIHDSGLTTREWIWATYGS